MEYRRPLDHSQHRHAVARIQSLQGYVRMVELDYPPRNAMEQKLWRRFRRCIGKFAAGKRVGDADAMNGWSQMADALMWEYLERRRRTV